MKKIISMFCTLAMVLSMAVVAHADENNYVEWKLVSKEGGNAVVEAHLVTTEPIVSMAMFWDISDAIAKGATGVTVQKGTCSNATYTAAQKMIMTNYTSIDSITGDVTMATFTFTGITEDFDITLKAASARTNTFFKSTDGDITSKFSTDTQTIKLVDEVKPSVDVATEVTSKDAISNPNGEKTWGVKAVATPANGGTFTKVIANLNNGSADAAVTVYEGTAIEAAATFGLNIMQVPAGVTITATVVTE